MRSQFNEPLWFYLNGISHVFFGGEHKLIIDDPFWQLLEEARVRVDVHHLRWLLRLEQAVRAWLLLQLCGVIEESGCDRFPHVREDVVINDREWLVPVIYLYSFAQLNQLVLNVPRTFHAPNLNKVLKAPIAWVFCFFPLLEHIQHSHVVTARPEEVLACVIRMQCFLLRSEKDSISIWEHCHDA